jgi:alkylation response protein AidB-like acyl-CoA dehydrogenase
MLGLGPIFQSENESARKRAAGLLGEGAIFAFGLSEREHGADVYSTDMVLTPRDDGEGWTASGGKYYIGNGNKAGMVSVFGRIEGVEGPEGYVFFAADSQHPRYNLIGNVVNSTNTRSGPGTSFTPARGRSTPRSTPSTSASSTSASDRLASASTHSGKR